MGYLIDSTTGDLIRESDGLRFTVDDRLPEYADYATWLAAGGEPRVFAAPVPAPTLPVDEFRSRFTAAEMLAVLNLAYSGDATARLLIFKLQTVQFVALDHPEIVGGLAYLSAHGVIAADRVAEILA